MTLGVESKDRARRSSFLVFGEPLIGEEEIAEVVDTLRSGWIGTGPKTRLFEERFRAYVESTHALAVSSCTAGMHLALDALEIGVGHEVITSPITFAATANVIVHSGATPVFADVDPGTMNLDVRAVEAAITPRTRAVIAVHLAGRVAELGALRTICDSHGLALIADAAHGIESRYQGRPASAWADLSIFSFYATKNLTTAEGGMVVTDDDALADKITIRRLHGISHDAWSRYLPGGDPLYETLYPGFKYNMTDLQASLGIHQLARLDRNWEVRARHAGAYREALSEEHALALPGEETDPANRHAHHLFPVLLDIENLSVDRYGVAQALREENIGCGIHFTPLHLHRYYRERFGYQTGSLPNAEWVGERTLSLPLSAKLVDRDVEDVIGALRAVIAESGGFVA
jgi:dTDP-4-amino-4,6-dideoxygalactose transaminase